MAVVNNTYTYRMPAGIAGAVNREWAHIGEPNQLDLTAPPTAYGDPVKINASSRIQALAAGDTAAAIYGFRGACVPWRQPGTTYGACHAALGCNSARCRRVLAAPLMKAGYISVVVSRAPPPPPRAVLSMFGSSARRPVVVSAALRPRPMRPPAIRFLSPTPTGWVRRMRTATPRSPSISDLDFKRNDGRRAATVTHLLARARPSSPERISKHVRFFPACRFRRGAFVRPQPPRVPDFRPRPHGGRSDDGLGWRLLDQRVGAARFRPASSRLQATPTAGTSRCARMSPLLTKRPASPASASRRPAASIRPALPGSARPRPLSPASRPMSARS